MSTATSGSKFVDGLVKVQQQANERRAKVRQQMLDRELAHDLSQMPVADLDALAQSLMDQPISPEDSLERFVEHINESWSAIDTSHVCRDCGEVMHLDHCPGCYEDFFPDRPE